MFLLRRVQDLNLLPDFAACNQSDIMGQKGLKS